MLNLFVGLYFFYLGIDIICSEVSKQRYSKAMRNGIVPVLRFYVHKISDPFSEVEAIGEKIEEPKVDKDTVQ